MKANEVQPNKITSQIKTILADSPFAWFAETWEKITSEEWVLALPARVWVDWATCILRTGYSMAYLWEASWYESLAREILAQPDEKADFIGAVLAGMEPAMVWRSKEQPAEIRDLSSKLKWRCYKSLAVKSVLDNWVKNNSAGELGLEQFLVAIRSDGKAIKDLKDALSPNKDLRSEPAEHLWEAIKYSLLTREKGDHYGFLESAGPRYLFAAPGIEWCALMASMAAEKPGAITNLGVVSEKLAKSGTQTEAKELLSLLERTGLARGSADADLALQVETAYKQGDLGQ